MTAPNSSQGPGGMGMNMGQPGLPNLAPAQQGLPTLAPAPPQQHQQTIQTSQIQQMHAGQPGAPHQTLAGQPMTLQHNVQGQPQFIIQQPAFAGGQQYTTFPQFAYTNQQGQLVLQPAPQFSLPGAPNGQPQGQQVILTNMHQKPGQPQMLGSGPGPTGKPGQPTYTITSSGPIQMPGGGQPGGQQQTFMITNPMGPGMQGPVTMSAPNGQPSLQLPTSMAGMKGADGKPLNMPPNQIAGSPNQQQFVIPSPGMAYMPTAAGPHQFIQNGQHLIFRAPGPHEQQVMFSPSGQPPQQPQHQLQQPPSSMSQGPNQAMGGMQMPGPRPQMPSAPPPGKTAISRAIAPLPNTATQAGNRMGLHPAGMPNQPSPKSKQKMSPRGGGNNVGRPPVPKGGQMKMMPPRMATSGPVSMSGPLPPQIPMNMHASMPRAPLPVHPVSQQQLMSGPPTLSPMMMTSEGMQVSMSNMITSMSSMPQSQIPSYSTIPTFSTTAPTFSTTMSTYSNSVPVSSVPPMQTMKANEPSLDPPPPTLTKEIANSLPPNLGQPEAAPRPLQATTAPEHLGVTMQMPTAPIVTTPKAVVKPQVFTHVIDGHVIKESSQPFPVSPIKAVSRRKSEKTEESKLANGGTKRGPGRPPGSTNKNNDNKNSGIIEPAEKKMKMKEDSLLVAPQAPASIPVSVQPQPHPVVYPAAVTQPMPPTTTVQPLQPVIAQQQQQPLPVQTSQPIAVAPPNQQQPQQQLTSPTKPQPSLLSSLKGNPLKWNVTEVCDFVKALPGCGEYVDDFAQQEIDGQALMLLKADHLMSAMSIKLGPALKICSHIEQIREELARL